MVIFHSHVKLPEGSVISMHRYIDGWVCVCVTICLSFFPRLLWSFGVGLWEEIVFFFQIRGWEKKVKKTRERLEEIGYSINNNYIGGFMPTIKSMYLGCWKAQKKRTQSMLLLTAVALDVFLIFSPYTYTPCRDPEMYKKWRIRTTVTSLSGC